MSLPQMKRISGIECWIVRVHPGDPQDHYDVVILNEPGMPPTVWQSVPEYVFDVPEAEYEMAPRRGRQSHERPPATSNQELQLMATRCEYWKS